MMMKIWFDEDVKAYTVELEDDVTYECLSKAEVSELVNEVLGNAD